MNNSPIGIFDSGVGGLSVLSEIEKLLPLESFIFVADQAFVPYGAKTKDELLDRVEKILIFLEKQNVKAVVAACNTATVYTIDEIREKFKIPIIGTVPVIKTIASVTKSKKTAVFSTPATAKSQYLQDLIKKYAQGVVVYSVGGTGLEELVEKGDIKSLKIKSILNTYLAPLIARGVDAIALGCTHYPFLRQEIEKVVGPNVCLVDSGGAVARRLKTILQNNDLLSKKRKESIYYTTGEAVKFGNVAKVLLKRQLNKVEHLDL